MNRTRASRTVLWVAALVLLAAAVVIAPAVVQARGLGEGANVAQLLSIPLAAVPLLVALVLWRRRTTRPVPLTPARLAEARGVLAEGVWQHWEEEARLRGLLPEPIPVPWRVTHRNGLQDRPSAITTGSLLLFDDGTDIARLAHDFRHQLACQRLVLLGEAGTGKTSLARA